MSPGLVATSYVAATAASLTAVLGGARAYYSRQRKRWVQEGEDAKAHSDALKANTKASEANTKAVNDLAGKFDRFADEQRRHQTTQDSRLDRLEEWRSGITAGFPIHRP